MPLIEGIMYQSNAPKDADPDQIFFVQVDADKCEGCGECNAICPTGVIQPINENGIHCVVDSAACVNCGQCLINCPAGAIYEGVSYIDEISEKLKDPETIVVSLIYPAVHHGLGECFGTPTSTNIGDKMPAALRELGFNWIWDTEFATNATIMEESAELIQRVKANGHNDHPLSQITSCCPGWIKFIETFYPDLIPNLSTRKSPIAMLGALAKTNGAQKAKIGSKKVYTVSITPCIGQKYEGLRPELNRNGQRDIDATIDTRELAYMIKKASINFNNLPDQDSDPIQDKSASIDTLFGNNGGAMRTAFRQGYEALTRTNMDNSEEEIGSTESIKVANIEVPNFGIMKIAVVSGLKNAAQLCDEVREGKSPYHFIEVMSCPGGCVNGGGQPLTPKIQASIRSRSTKRDYCVRWG